MLERNCAEGVEVHICRSMIRVKDDERCRERGRETKRERVTERKKNIAKKEGKANYALLKRRNDKFSKCKLKVGVCSRHPYSKCKNSLHDAG